MNNSLNRSQNDSVGGTPSASDHALRSLFVGRRRLGAVAIAIASAASVGAVLATPGSGAVGTVMARAWLADDVDIKIKLRDAPEVIHVLGTAETVMQQIVFAPGGHTGWHSHPGPAIALVKSGELTLYSGDDPSCAGRTYTAGQAFIDSGQGHAHMARNLRLDQPAEVWVTYLDVPQGAVRIDAADPGFCPF